MPCHYDQYYELGVLGPSHDTDCGGQEKGGVRKGMFAMVVKAVRLQQC
jgi:hypothetical protein